ncbi:hypothetical protein HJG60_007952 [Phyllostomus discolor]|uniref:Uncharacterized protein n=1 Tax=Phyllostomus discolor TaxID=89673 RepID=A0A834EVD2_9CHIR|nr:hypothetical protein HJG60_007952 [Phyllostomus discolor]
MHACCIPLHTTVPIKAISEKGSGHSPLEGITIPFPATTDCVWDNSPSSAAAGRALPDRAPHIEPIVTGRFQNYFSKHINSTIGGCRYARCTYIFISFTMMKTPNYIQLYSKSNTLMIFLRFY